jgi:hypothetical protein
MSHVARNVAMASWGTGLRNYGYGGQ